MWHGVLITGSGDGVHNWWNIGAVGVVLLWPLVYLDVAQWAPSPKSSALEYQRWNTGIRNKLSITQSR
jgi:hypothetical protein